MNYIEDRIKNLEKKIKQHDIMFEILFNILSDDIANNYDITPLQDIKLARRFDIVDVYKDNEE